MLKTSTEFSQDTTIGASSPPSTTTVIITSTGALATPTNFYFADNVDYNFAVYYPPPEAYSDVQFSSSGTSGALLASLDSDGRLQDVNNPTEFASQPVEPNSYPFAVTFTDQVNPNNGSDSTDWVHCSLNINTETCTMVCTSPDGGYENTFSTGYPNDNYWYLGKPFPNGTYFEMYVVDADQ